MFFSFDNIKVVFTLLTEVVVFHMKVSIIQVGVIGLEESTQGLFLLWKSRKSSAIY